MTDFSTQPSPPSALLMSQSRLVHQLLSELEAMIGEGRQHIDNGADPSSLDFGLLVQWCSVLRRYRDHFASLEESVTRSDGDGALRESAAIHFHVSRSLLGDMRFTMEAEFGWSQIWRDAARSSWDDLLKVAREVREKSPDGPDRLLTELLREQNEGSEQDGL